LAIHNHQPLGNFPWVFEEAYQSAYLPMLDSLERHPNIRISMHNSGCLLDWLECNHPDFLLRLTSLVKRRQIEIMSGAYYEPILPAIPDADKLGQIKKMNSYITKRFGVNSTGMWLAERVWEPHLAKIVADAGIEWTLVDDIAFKAVGIDDSDLFGYFKTEEQGRSLNIFPISKLLRYSIPWHDVDQIIAYLRQHVSETEVRIAVLGDDGEKFGMWPKTFEHCWTNRWVDRFFEALEKNRDWIHVIPLGDFTIRFAPSGRIYLPCSSYDEMLEWSLPAQKSWEFTNLKHQLESEGEIPITQYMHSGFWRNFLVRYPEVNRMHKKMLRVHHKVYEANSISGEDCGLEELWKAQCNCPYWHGVFGGVYLADIRASTYSYLIEAEYKADKVIYGERSWLRWQKVDYDYDGFEELLIDSKASSLYISPMDGGSIFEWDIHSRNYNLMGTLARRPESYHQALYEQITEEQTEGENVAVSIHDAITVKDKTISRYLTYDRYPKSSFIDHFLNSEIEFKDFIANSYEELGDFVGKPYEVTVKSKVNTVAVSLSRRGSVTSRGHVVPVEVFKQVSMSANTEKLKVFYQLKNLGDYPVNGIFGNEWNFNLLGGGHNEHAYYKAQGITLDDYHLDSLGEMLNVEKVAFGNRQLGIELELVASQMINIWRLPIESISNSEGGIERIYQANCLLILLPVVLSAGEMMTVDFLWSVKKPSISI
jgi:alpha-amylase